MSELKGVKPSGKEWCYGCEMHVEPDYVTRECIAPYGTVIYGKGYCPDCGRLVVGERMIDDDGLHPPAQIRSRWRC